MKELLTMWKYSRMVALTVFCAGVYMLFLLPSKAVPVFPGYAGIRPAALLPVVFGLLFGPAGAWGSALGSLAGDLLGKFGVGSIFSFAGNFLYAFIPYRLWRSFRSRHGEDKQPTINSPSKLINFGLVSLAASAACAVVTAWGLDALKLFPFAPLSIFILLNNAVITLIFGPILLPVAYRLAKKAGILWTGIMHGNDISKPSPDRVSRLMIYAGAFGGLVIGLAFSLLFAGQSLIGQDIATSGVGNLVTGAGILPFLVVLFYGALNS